MSSIRNKVFRDSKGGGRLVPVPPSVKNVIDTTPMQRLGGIKQMGVAHLVFRGATHTRLAHSIGVFDVARYIFSELKRKSEQFDEISTAIIGMGENEFSEFTIAALLHDLGHSPFSHALESVLQPAGSSSHEQTTIRIIEEDPEIRNRIRNVTDVDAVIAYIYKRYIPTRH